MIMLSVLRFADAYQHTYEAFAVLEDGGKLPEDKRRDRSYEQQNTYSNVVSERWPALNLLLLNFSFHNAHHEKPVAPRYRLPKLHAELYGSTYNRSSRCASCSAASTATAYAACWTMTTGWSAKGRTRPTTSTAPWASRS